jgi:hypothetical protein
MSRFPDSKRTLLGPLEANIRTKRVGDSTRLRFMINLRGKEDPAVGTRSHPPRRQRESLVAGDSPRTTVHLLAVLANTSGKVATPS